MPTAAIYKINKKGYLLHSDVKAISGFRVASDPFIRIRESDADINTIVDAIKGVLETDDATRVADPKDWNEHSKDFLRKTGLKSLKELNKPSTMYCGIEKRDGDIIFTPTKHAEKPDEGFVNKSKDEPNVVIPYDSSNEDIYQAFELALSRCE